MVKPENAEAQRLFSLEITEMIRAQLNLPVMPSSHPAPPNQQKIPKGVRISNPTSINKNYDTPYGFARLSQYNTVFIIDDTGSMQQPAKSYPDSDGPHPITRWELLTRSLEQVGQIAADNDEDGVDIYFIMNHDLQQKNLKTNQEIQDLLAKVDLTKGSGGTYFQPILAEIMGPYRSKYQDYFEAQKESKNATQPKGLNIIVITDGEDDGADDTEEFIARYAKDLDKIDVPLKKVGIQFLQIGDDAKAAAYLKTLDDELKLRHQIRDVGVQYLLKYSTFFSPSHPLFFCWKK
jgi:hypothetical protein